MNQNATILRKRDVLKRTGLGKTSIYEFMRRGEFPQKVSLGARAVGWVASEVDSWIAGKIERRTGGTKK